MPLHETFNQGVLGSSPIALTNKQHDLTNQLQAASPCLCPRRHGSQSRRKPGGRRPLARACFRRALDAAGTLVESNAIVVTQSVIRSKMRMKGELIMAGTIGLP